MAGLTYMQRRTSGIYEFRKRLPEGLAGRPAPSAAPLFMAELINPKTGSFKRELTVSLGTSDPSKAKTKDMREALRVTELFERAQRYLAGGTESELNKPDMPSLEEIETDTVRELLKSDEEEREEQDIRQQLQTPDERAFWPDLEDARFGEMGMAESHLVAKGIEIELLRDEYRKAYARRDIAIIKPELHRYLKAHGVPIDPSSAYYQKAGLAVLKAHVKAYDLMADRQRGDDVQTPAASTDKGPKLSEALKLWQEGTPGRGSKKVSTSTSREAERAVKYFKEWHGDLRLGDLTKEKTREFRNALAKRPTRLTGKQRSMTLRAVVNAVKPDAEPMHVSSVNKYLNLLAALVTACEKEGLLDKLPGFSNPFHGLALPLDKRNNEVSRKPFSAEQLAALFGHGVYRSGVRPLGGGGEAAFWFPLIALLSGARLNEIGQLRVKDLTRDKETGIWFFDIGTDGGRSIKNAGSRRQVPVHAELVRIGLLRYREKRQKAGGENATLWPDVKSANDAYKGTAWSKWFNRFLRVTIGIKDAAIVFHSFRHTFKRMARDANLGEELHDALTGHSGGGVGRSYGAGFGLKALSEAMSKIEVPLIVQGLAASK